MNGLPIALQHPENGRYSVETAVSIWLQVAYGFPYGVPNEGRDYRLARQKVRIDLDALAYDEEGPSSTQVIRRRPSTWFPNNSRPVESATPPRVIYRWIDQKDLIRFAAEHGVELFAGAVKAMPEPEPIKAKPITRKRGRPKDITPEALDFAAREIGKGERTDKAVYLETIEKFGISATPDAIRKALSNR